MLATDLTGKSPTMSTVEFKFSLTGYLHYKKITPQSVLSEAQVKSFLLFRRKAMFRSQDIQVFLVLAIPQFSKSVTS